MSKYYDPKQLPKEPIHIIIDGIGGLHCKDNKKVLEERVDVLERLIRRSIDRLKSLEKELDNPTSNLSFDLKFKSVVDTIEYDSRIVYVDPREYYPNMLEDEEGDSK